MQRIASQFYNYISNRGFIFIFIFFCLCSPLCSAAESSPSQTATQLYRWAIKYDDGGLPKQKALALTNTILAQDLTQLFQKALVAEARCIKAAPIDYKPNILEGSLFVGNYESLTGIVTLKEKQHKGHTKITAHLNYTNPKRPADAISWVDKLTLVRENGKWVIKDIHFDIQPAKESNSLVALLKKYTSKEECGF